MNKQLKKITSLPESKMRLVFNKSLAAVSVAALFVINGHANAGLIKSTDGNLIYDDVSNITWLADVGTGGRMTWHEGKNWADSLVTFTFSDWRLATKGEGLALQSSSADFGLFTHIPSLDVQGRTPQFWSSTTINTPTNGVKTSWFRFDGTLNDPLSGDVIPGNGKKYAWAVTSGNIAGLKSSDGGVDATVPEPATMAIFSLGLAGLAYRRKKLKAEK